MKLGMSTSSWFIFSAIAVWFFVSINVDKPLQDWLLFGLVFALSMTILTYFVKRRNQYLEPGSNIGEMKFTWDDRK